MPKIIDLDEIDFDLAEQLHSNKKIRSDNVAKNFELLSQLNKYVPKD